ncbi:phosphoglycerate dehydrogenase [Candidatus Gracilibacteria bacterium]|nr:phosphoglycerate dehydrogenase [Candidatus Gracilibacteria bacterium]
MSTKTFSLEKSKVKILLLEGVHKKSIEAFNDDGYTQIDYYTHALPEAELLKIIPKYHFIGIRSRTQINEKVLKVAKKLIAIGCFCIGTNQVNLEIAKSLGIPVFNSPYSNTRSVAELVIGEMIMLIRGIPHRSTAAHKGEWLKNSHNAFEVRGKTVGIIGYGHIGSQTGILAEAMGMKVLYYDIERKLSLGNAQSIKTIKELLNKSDFITLHVPNTKQTQNMFGYKEIRQMKKGSHLINASRGTVVDIEALADALKSKHLLGAAIDVFPKEPKSKEEKFESPLQNLDNVILSPHIGGSTIEAQENIGINTAHKLIDYSNLGNTDSTVNFPKVSLPILDKSHNRYLHIHENKPGVMKSINELFLKVGINVIGQYLQTNDQIGYVVFDTETVATGNDNLLKKLKNIPGTIRARELF